MSLINKSAVLCSQCKDAEIGRYKVFLRNAEIVMEDKDKEIELLRGIIREFAHGHYVVAYDEAKELGVIE